ncbi:hypothetical protein GT370_09205 [Acidocella sp. MX-AZ03]|uniref:hypothetical protein n=1 Tax=Acidocella sp. MX-AZ03 TaxID=2697363 RepID=UPI0022DD2AAB|nr:hypothetical protein [Acidocella sp. MX-AZ03]WBO60880.1 hypothetical protein GT370_09205 [Acidocella sp. MX-AZ03]
MELLATVDWLNHESGVPLAIDVMADAIARWPGPEGAAERKVRVFTLLHIEVAINHLRATA